MKTTVHDVSTIVGVATETEQMAKEAERPLNFNVGILGHIDSGKTSLGMCASMGAFTVVTCGPGSGCDL